MSLDVYLTRKKFISYDAGRTHTEEDEIAYSSNITHNLGSMANEAGIYEALWRPHRLKDGYDKKSSHEAEIKFEEAQTTHAREIIPFLEKGLKDLKARPKFFKKLDSPNGWGIYKYFVPFVEEYLNACKKYPDAIVEVSR